MAASNSVPLVIGMSMVDIHHKLDTEEISFDGGFYESKVFASPGGVGGNIAESLYKLYGDVRLITVVGNDASGKMLKNRLPSKCLAGFKTMKNKPTATCSVFLNTEGECQMVVGDSSIHRYIDKEFISINEDLFKNAPLIVLDANLPMETIQEVLYAAGRNHKPVFYDPTDFLIAAKPFKLPRNCINHIKFISPNLNELRAIYKHFKNLPYIEESKPDDDLEKILKEVHLLCMLMMGKIDHIIVTLGHHGVYIRNQLVEGAIVFDKNYDMPNSAGMFHGTFYRAPKVLSVVNASGAGDAFSAGFITGLLKHMPEHICVKLGFQASWFALQSPGAVPTTYFNVDDFCAMEIQRPFVADKEFSPNSEIVTFYPEPLPKEPKPLRFWQKKKSTK